MIRLGSFKSKIYLIVFLSSVLISIGFSVLLALDNRKTYTELKNETAAILSAFLSSPLQFATKEGIEEVVQIFGLGEEGLLYLAVFDKDGVFFMYPESAPQTNLERFYSAHKLKERYTEFVGINQVWFYSHIYDTAGAEVIGGLVAVFERNLRSLVLSFLGLMLMSFAIGGIMLFLAHVVLRSGMRNLALLRDVFSKLSSGYLQEVSVASQDEFGYIASAWNGVEKKIREILSGIKTVCDNLLGYAGNLSNGSEELSQLVGQISGNIAQTSNAVDEFSTSLGESSRQAGNLSVKSEEIYLISSESMEKVEEVVRMVKDFLIKIQELLRSGDIVSKNINGITSMVAVIEDVADLTNLLALNAAIEAARAGDAGRGFAVVADEVRKLADRVRTEANNIKVVVEKIGSAWSGLTSYIKEVAESFKWVVDRIEGFSLSYKEIIGRTRTQKDMASALSSAVEEQSATAREVSRNITAFLGAVEQLRGMVSNLLNMAVGAKEASEKLRDLISFFKD